MLLAGTHAEHFDTFQLEMMLCSVFQAAGVGNTLKVQSGKTVTIISFSQRPCPGIQSSSAKWKTVVCSEQFSIQLHLDF